MRTRAAAALLSVICAATPQGLAAQNASDLRARIDALRAAPQEDPFASEKATDLARIAAESPWLFARRSDTLGPVGSPVAVVLFTAPDCGSCAAAEAELEALAYDIGIGATIMSTEDGAFVAAGMGRLSLDLTPSYVTRNTLIRGHIPAFVLQRYLAE
ncbi:hypothetical protein [Pacificoceanicola onchidii]|uniref:hypothetical protein n=1 Tax=Pacificoceanicola onchidii TaxID=2562685 RepID=UPI0010A52B73|nr:hypothetical protein [Pacificoceanicola onchidii]